MAISLTQEQRKARLAAAAERVGGKASLGKRLGYQDGSFVGQMIRGDRPITEKTLDALLNIREVADLFSSSWPAPVVVDPAPLHTHEPSQSYPARPSLQEALPVVLGALAQLPALRWASVRAQLELLVQHPAMLDDAVAELLQLLSSCDKERPLRTG